MPLIFAANSSGVVVNGQAVEGLRSVDYHVTREQGNVHALGTHERIGVYYGASHVEGCLRIASASAALDALVTSGDKFQVVASLKQGQTTRSVSFDECYMVSKDFGLPSGQYGETAYNFTATRVREEDGGGAATTPAA